MCVCTDGVSTVRTLKKYVKDSAKASAILTLVCFGSAFILFINPLHSMFLNDLVEARRCKHPFPPMFQCVLWRPCHFQCVPFFIARAIDALEVSLANIRADLDALQLTKVKHRHI